MRKSLLRTALYAALVISALYLSACSGEDDTIFERTVETQDDRESVKAEKLGVKHRLATSYFYTNSGQLSEQGYKVEDVYYDEMGNKLEQIRYSSGAYVMQRWVIEYVHGYKVKKMEIYEGERLSYSHESKYDDAGNEIERKVYEIKKGNYSIEFEFDEKNQMVDKTVYDDAGRIESIEKYKYENNLLKESEMRHNQKVVNRKEYVNNENGHKIMEIVSSPNNNFSDTTRFAYASNGLVELEKKRHIFTKYSYNQNGDKTSEAHYDHEGYQQQKVVYEYGPQGLLQSMTKYDGENNPVIFTEYTYDYY